MGDCLASQSVSQPANQPASQQAPSQPDSQTAGQPGSLPGMTQNQIYLRKLMILLSKSAFGQPRQ